MDKSFFLHSNNHSILASFLLLLCMSALLLTGAGCTSMYWKQAKEIDTIEGYQYFIDNHSDEWTRRHAYQRIKKIKQTNGIAIFRNAVANKPMDAYFEYANTYSEDKKWLTDNNYLIIFKNLSDTEINPLLNSIKSIVINIEIDDTVSKEPLLKSVLYLLNKFSKEQSKYNRNKIIINNDVVDNNETINNADLNIKLSLTGDRTPETFKTSTGQIVELYTQSCVYGRLTTSVADIKLIDDQWFYNKFIPDYNMSHKLDTHYNYKTKKQTGGVRRVITANKNQAISDLPNASIDEAIPGSFYPSNVYTCNYDIYRNHKDPTNYVEARSDEKKILSLQKEMYVILEDIFCKKISDTAITIYIQVNNINNFTKKELKELSSPVYSRFPKLRTNKSYKNQSCR